MLCSIVEAKIAISMVDKGTSSKIVPKGLVTDIN